MLSAVYSADVFVAAAALLDEETRGGLERVRSDPRGEDNRLKDERGRGEGETLVHSTGKLITFYQNQMRCDSPDPLITMTIT